jgi:hypothetical protein
MVFGSPRLDDEQPSLQFGMTLVFNMMDGTSVETRTYQRQPECLLMSYGKAQKLMRTTYRSKGRNAVFYVIDVTPAEFRLPEQKQNFTLERSLLHNNGTTSRRCFMTIFQS